MQDLAMDEWMEEEKKEEYSSVGERATKIACWKNGIGWQKNHLKRVLKEIYLRLFNISNMSLHYGLK
jgi:hypothetical protein